MQLIEAFLKLIIPFKLNKKPNQLLGGSLIRHVFFALEKHGHKHKTIQQKTDYYTDKIKNNSLSFKIE